MHCLISVVMRRWSAVFEGMQAYKRQLLEPAAALGIARPAELDATRGFLLLVDWDGERILGGRELDKPLGFLLDGERLHVAQWGDDGVTTFAGGEVLGRFRHPWFNHVHTLDRTPRGLLVSSSGTDLLAEIDADGNLVWEYFLFEHHPAARRLRLAQQFSRALNYNQRYIPAALSTHPNSAILTDDHTVLATLFTTGELCRIDRRSGQADVVLSGLRRPHSIRRRAGGGFMLCDTEGGRVVLLSAELRHDGELAVPAPWIQDAVIAGERMLVVGNRRIVMSPLKVTASATDGDNCVIELRGNNPSKRLNFGPDNRIYMVEPLPASAAEILAHAWRDEPLEVAGLRWEPACA